MSLAAVLACQMQHIVRADKIASHTTWYQHYLELPACRAQHSVLSAPSTAEKALVQSTVGTPVFDTSDVATQVLVSSGVGTKQC